jgi:hypothetical protein
MLMMFLLMSPNLTSTASACFLSGIIFHTLEMPSPPVTKHCPRRFVRQSNVGLPDDRRLAVAPEKQKDNTEFGDGGGRQLLLQLPLLLVLRPLPPP